MKFIDLNKQFELMELDINTSIQKVLKHGNYIMGEEVSIFENQLSEFINVKHTISCANGTDALQLALMAIGVGPGDTVFTSSFSYFATAEAISLVGATPVFIDIEASTFNIDVKKLQEKINLILDQGGALPSTIISVDLFGLPADYTQLIKLAEKYDLKLIEDAAQGLGGQIGERVAGSFGDISTTSFFPAKPLGCYGDGGALFTNNDFYAERLKSLRVHGKGDDKYDNVRIGMNSRLDTIQAAILIVKLKSFEREIELRNTIAKKYDCMLDGRFRLPIIPSGYKSVWAQYSLLADSKEDRKNIMLELKSKDIPSIIYYSKPLHLQPAFTDLGYVNGDLPISENVSSRIFSIPMYPYLQDNQLKIIVDALNSNA